MNVLDKTLNYLLKGFWCSGSTHRLGRCNLGSIPGFPSKTVLDKTLNFLAMWSNG